MDSVSDAENTMPVVFRLDGPKIAESINLYDLTTCLHQFHCVLDRSYSILSGHKRLSKANRSMYMVRASGFKQNSFEVNLDIFIPMVQLTVPYINAVSPAAVWDCAWRAFDLLKHIFTAIRAGESVHIDQSGNTGTIIYMGDGGVIKLPDSRCLKVADLSRKHYAKIASTLEDGGIEEFKVGSPRNADCNIAITLTQKDLFSAPTVVDQTPVRFSANIFDFNKDTQCGRLRVYPDQSQQEGEFSFSVIGNQDIAKYIESMLQQRVWVTALEERTMDPIEQSRRFQVIDVEQIAKHG